jgi:hypothetical protein
MVVANRAMAVCAQRDGGGAQRDAVSAMRCRGHALRGWRPTDGRSATYGRGSRDAHSRRCGWPTPRRAGRHKHRPAAPAVDHKDGADLHTPCDPHQFSCSMKDNVTSSITSTSISTRSSSRTTTTSTSIEQKSKRSREQHHSSKQADRAAALLTEHGCPCPITTSAGRSSRAGGHRQSSGTPGGHPPIMVGRPVSS